MPSYPWKNETFARAVMRRRENLRNVLVLFPSSGISVVFGIVELVALSILIREHGAARPIESEKHRYQIARALLIVAILFAAVQILNCTFFWYRQNRVRLRCSSLILIDAAIIALCNGSRLNTGPRVADSSTRNPGAKIANMTPTALWAAVTLLGVHVVTFVAWTWLIPARMRLPNRHRPTAYNRAGWLRIIRGRRESPPQPDGLGQELTSLLPLESLFRKHEKAWKASRQAAQASPTEVRYR